ncbi:S-adenosyl-L-methionine-dependent methyltransferase [Neohortaea acidophila]|uniref:S-adenosyl-L-methionine-dependent methyltransferase n=1 Tax=Neohortaea acidophila TaxID=245834 RepID=A0A6A6PNB8_9PEZI|nr:S-adenosyl-L-methionine-dependent methyltransferase [Neohortaea acidophila]KAF2480923.1 S-adenosyl-L-methionine-dependent methyltransferase [Neohortaea acidophila]
MSLYHEAAEVFAVASKDGGSIKSIVFSKKKWKSDGRTLFALTTETAKWSDVLSKVIENSGVLKVEKQLSPQLALLLVHDLLLAPRGLALTPKHGLAASITKHKARLSAELTKERLRRGFASIDALRSHVNGSAGDVRSGLYRHPRWIRINTLRTSLAAQLETTFASFKPTSAMTDIMTCSPADKLVHTDQHVPNLLAVPPGVDITSHQAYKDGKLIIQDKASCFPAYLLDPSSTVGDIIDACAAPGNKTTHLAALTSSGADQQTSPSRKRKIFACERDAERSKTLSKMVRLAGADSVVQVRTRQDFLKVSPQAAEFANVTAILLDPSCSGSGIVGRDEAVLNLHLPAVDTENGTKTTHRKRKHEMAEAETKQLATDDTSENVPLEGEAAGTKLQDRLAALSSFQLRLLEHAMTFHAVARIAYSTCSLHDEENEQVVAKALLSDVAVERGWKILRREQQVDGMQAWSKRGRVEAVAAVMNADTTEEIDADVVAEACIRCEKGGEDGTMGFFVAGFMRDVEARNGGVQPSKKGAAVSATLHNGTDLQNGDEEEWEGFSDQE